MTPTTLQQPVILLLAKRAANQDDVDTWLAESPYSACEATNVFHALEQISDFTVGETPDVVFLHVDRMDAELEMLEHMLLATDGDFRPSVIAYADLEMKWPGNHAAGLGSLASQLERLIPTGPQVN